MAISPADRALHVKETISTLRRELGTRNLDSLIADPLDLAGFKYLLLIISEAAGSVNAEILWEISKTDLDPLEAAIDRMLSANPPPPARS